MGKIVYEKPTLIKLQEISMGGPTIPPMITPPPLPPAYTCANGSSPGSGMTLAGCSIGMTANTT